MTDVVTENLVPQQAQKLSQEEFLESLAEWDGHYAERKASLRKGEVLRYVGELSGDLMRSKGTLKVSLQAVRSNSPLGSVKGADSLVEIYTESYGERPLVIQGAGAGPEVTARGVFGDILRIAERN